jgi:hypothetical protein
MLTFFATALVAAQTQMPPIGQRAAPPARLAVGASLIPDADQDPLIAAAAAFPLGSAQNPVRVGGPAGERAYLSRLRCADGASPRLGARSDGGVGAFGSLVAAYRLECAAGATNVVIDMYHEEHVEDRAPPGFSIIPR